MAPKPIPSSELLRQLLRYDPETGKLYWRERRVEHFRDSATRKASHICALWNVRYSGKEAFCKANYLGYLCGFLLGEHHKAHRIIFALVTGSCPPEVDHINGIRSDNRWVNLRGVDRREQMKNTAMRSDNTSGAIGVSKEKNSKSWRARIANKNIGFFPTFDLAVEARRKAEIEHGYHPNHGRAA